MQALGGGPLPLLRCLRIRLAGAIECTFVQLTVHLTVDLRVQALECGPLPLLRCLRIRLAGP